MEKKKPVWESQQVHIEVELNTTLNERLKPVVNWWWLGINTLCLGMNVIIFVFGLWQWSRHLAVISGFLVGLVLCKQILGGILTAISRRNPFDFYVYVKDNRLCISAQNPLTMPGYSNGDRPESEKIKLLPVLKLGLKTKSAQTNRDVRGSHSWKYSHWDGTFLEITDPYGRAIRVGNDPQDWVVLFRTIAIVPGGVVALMSGFEDFKASESKYAATTERLHKALTDITVECESLRAKLDTLGIALVRQISRIESEKKLGKSEHAKRLRQELEGTLFIFTEDQVKKWREEAAREQGELAKVVTLHPQPPASGPGSNPKGAS